MCFFGTSSFLCYRFPRPTSIGLSIKLRLCSFTHGKSLNYTILSKIYKASKTGVLINKNKQSPLEHLSIKAPIFDSLLFPHTYFQIYQLWFNYVIKFARHACLSSCVCNLESCAENVYTFWQGFHRKILNSIVFATAASV